VISCESALRYGPDTENEFRLTMPTCRICRATGDAFRGTPTEVLDGTHLLQAAGWRPRIGLDEGLRLLARELPSRF
jgi:hypothetical protein